MQPPLILFQLSFLLFLFLLLNSFSIQSHLTSNKNSHAVVASAASKMTLPKSCNDDLKEIEEEMRRYFLSFI